MCQLCDAENGYAIHQPGDVCAICKPNEGRNSLYLAFGGLGALAILAAITQCGLCPRFLSRVKRVAVISGKHAGRVGQLAGPLDKLNFAIRARA